MSHKEASSRLSLSGAVTVAAATEEGLIKGLTAPGNRDGGLEDSIALFPKLCAHKLTSEFSLELLVKELLKASHHGWNSSHPGKN